MLLCRSSVAFSCAILILICGATALAGPVAEPSFQGLGDLPGGEFQSEAFGVSGDGTIVVGDSIFDEPSRSQAFRWTMSGGMEVLGGVSSPIDLRQVWAVSRDGTLIVVMDQRCGVAGSDG